MNEILSSNKPRPGLRFCARFIDNSIFGEIIWGFFVPLKQTPDEVPVAGVIILSLFAWVFVESLLLKTWGTTPGKAILAIDLQSADGRALTFLRCLKRSFGVWFKGMAMGFPIANLVTLYFSWYRLDQTGVSSWDRNNGFAVTHRPITPLRATLVTLLIAGIIALNIMSIAVVSE
jgi:uncharacterized RDD family membrane protein YckC